MYRITLTGFYPYFKTGANFVFKSERQVRKYCKKLEKQLGHFGIEVTYERKEDASV